MNKLRLWISGCSFCLLSLVVLTQSARAADCLSGQCGGTMLAQNTTVPDTSRDSCSGGRCTSGVAAPVLASAATSAPVTPSSPGASTAPGYQAGPYLPLPGSAFTQPGASTASSTATTTTTSSGNGAAAGSASNTTEASGTTSSAPGSTTTTTSTSTTIPAPVTSSSKSSAPAPMLIADEPPASEQVLHTVVSDGYSHGRQYARCAPGECYLFEELVSCSVNDYSCRDGTRRIWSYRPLYYPVDNRELLNNLDRKLCPSEKDCKWPYSRRDMY